MPMLRIAQQVQKLSPQYPLLHLDAVHFGSGRKGLIVVYFAAHNIAHIV